MSGVEPVEIKRDDGSDSESSGDDTSASPSASPKHQPAVAPTSYPPTIASLDKDGGGKDSADKDGKGTVASLLPDIVKPPTESAVAPPPPPPKKDADSLAHSGELLAETEADALNGCSVMMSYSRKDKGFVKNIYNALTHHDETSVSVNHAAVATGRNIWVDWEDIPPSNDWLNEIHKGIEQSDVFLFILSPDSIKSEVCNWEVDHAVKNGKRIIPCVVRDVDYRSVRKELANLNWIFFRSDGEDFDTAMRLLIKQIDMNGRHARYHTKLLVRALDWEKHEFEKSLLLRGNDLNRAKHWMSDAALGKEPKPTTLHLSYINESERLYLTSKRRKLVAIFFAFTLGIAVPEPQWGVFFFALVFSHFLVFFASNYAGGQQ